ncbi:MAG: type IX secretion system membrane protein PorP/SprF [Microscillaceae bacterium]
MCAQQDAQFTQFMFNKLFFNPAFAGVEHKTLVHFIHRAQWTGYQPSFDDGRAPNTQVLGFNTALLRFNSGIGAHIVVDRLGPLTNLELQFSYAYHIKLNKDTRLSLGLRGGMYSRIIDFDKYRFAQPDDPLDVQNGSESVIKPDMAVGIYYYSPTFFGGLSANHLTQSEFNFGDGFNRDALVNSFYLMGGYRFKMDRQEKWVLTPSLLVKASELQEFSFDVGTLVEYDEKFWLGSTFRNEESINFLAGVVIPRKPKRSKGRLPDPRFKIGAGFDYVYAGQEAKQTASYEVFFSYELPIRPPTYPALIRTPRFRY